MNSTLSKALTVGVCSVLLGCGLGADVTLEVFNLSVTPSTAQEGDLVAFTFQLTVVAEGSVTLAAVIDDEEYSTQQASRLFSDIVLWEIADAGVLIEHFGLGAHTARVRVTDPASDHTAYSEQVTFNLIAPAQ